MATDKCYTLKTEELFLNKIQRFNLSKIEGK